jgi:hypothetical protein
MLTESGVVFKPFRDAIVAGQEILGLPQQSARGVQRITR